MTIENEYNIGDILYLKTDKEQLERIVTAIKISPVGITYQLTCGTTDNMYFAIEVSKEKSLLSNRGIGFNKG